MTAALGALGGAWRGAERAAPVAPPATSRAPAPSPAPAPGATFVGRGACATCHPEQVRLWAGSHHDRSMQVADARTVLADFAGATFAYAGTTTSFATRDGRYFVATDGPGGIVQEYEVAYTFGVYPLQQYLVRFTGGRLQALPFAWDARSRSEGGQRWFHLYPDDRLTSDDALHWTQPAQNWNAQCARCHSTDVRKGYRPDDDRYETTWSEIDVACEACHGPASTHVARAEAGVPAEEARRALMVRLRAATRWAFDGVQPIARRSGGAADTAELTVCAPCHARRAEISASALPGRPLLDAYVPARLDAGLYFADGQIDGEVFEYGSFTQSAMHRAGVTCSDCHDPHSLRLRAEGNALCGRCHLSSHFDRPAHHLHASGSPGARCVACHMPARTYMGIDERRDHSLRVPRPDVSARLGTPDPCTACHTERSAAWAAAVLAERAAPPREARPHFGDAIAAARRGAPDAAPALLGLVEDAREPAIVRASALSLLRELPGERTAAAIVAAAGDPDPEVRLAALDAMPAVGSPAVLDARLLRLTDARAAVRFAAAAALSALPAGDIAPALRDAATLAAEEYRVVQAANADRPQSHLNLSLLALARGRPAEAAAALRTAIRLDARFVPAYVNLADLLRMERRDGEGEALLRDGLRRVPGSAALHHALGLLLVRERRIDEALGELERAATLAPDSGRYARVLGIALRSAGWATQAEQALRAAGDR